MNLSRSSIAPLALAALTAVTACAAVTAFAQTGGAGGIPWIHSTADALAAARQANAPIVAFVTSSHCHYCQKMEAQTWSNDSVIRQVTGSFIPLRLDADREPQVVESLRVRAFPTTVVFTPQGQVIDSAQGFQSPAKLARLLEHSTAQSPDAVVFH